MSSTKKRYRIDLGDVCGNKRVMLSLERSETVRSLEDKVFAFVARQEGAKVERSDLVGLASEGCFAPATELAEDVLCVAENEIALAHWRTAAAAAPAAAAAAAEAAAPVTAGAPPTPAAPAPASTPAGAPAPAAATATAPTAGAVVVFDVFTVASLGRAVGSVSVAASAPFSAARSAVLSAAGLAAGDLHLAAHGLVAADAASEATTLDAWGLADDGAATTTWAVWAHARSGPADADGDGDQWAVSAWRVEPAQTTEGLGAFLSVLRVVCTRRESSEASFERFARNLAELTCCAPAVLAARALHARARVSAASRECLAAAVYASEGIGHGPRPST